MKPISCLAIATALTTGWPVPARADGSTGWLVQKCSAFEREADTTPDSVRFGQLDSALCFGYFSGVHSLAFLRDETDHALLGFCAPLSTKPDAFIHIFQDFARRKKPDPGQPAVLSVWAALAAAFPCGQAASG